MTSRRVEKLREVYRTSRTIISQLPIKFDTNLSWHTLTITCEKCRRDVPDSQVHGTVTSLIPSVITVEGVAFCEKCLLLHQVMYRFRADGSVELVNKSGQWVTIQSKDNTRWDHLFDTIKDIYRKTSLFFVKRRS